MRELDANLRHRVPPQRQADPRETLGVIQVTRAPAITRMLGGITMTAGLLCLAVGVTIAVAWSVRSTAILRFGSSNPMSFNTALALTVTGAALVVLSGGWWPRAALVAGLFDAVLGLLVLAEYVTGRDLGIDQLFVHAYLSGPYSLPGRVSVNAATCWLLAGLGLLTWAPWRPRSRPATITGAGSLIAAIAIIALFGYASSRPAAYTWGRLSSMALVTAVTMLVLALALLAAAWRSTQPGSVPLVRSLPIAVIALGLAAGVWLALAGRADRAGQLSADRAINAATVLAVLMASLVAVAVWLAQRADVRRGLAQAEAARRAEAEARARESEVRTFQFLDALPTGLFIATAGGRPYYANAEAQRTLGRGVLPDVAAQQLAETYQAFLAGTEQLYPTERLPVVRAFRGEASHIDDQEVHQPDGTVIPIEAWGRPIRGAGGQIDYAVVVFADITERNAQERTMAAQAALLDLAHDAILVRDADGLITYWSAGAEHTYGFARSDALGHIAHELLRTEFSEPLAHVEAKVNREGRWDGEITQRCADGRAITVESRWAAQRHPNGALQGFMEVNRDVTARKMAERELETRSEEIQALNATLERQVQERTVHLERANQNLEAFTYSVAHDLRTPLRAMSGFAEVLVEDYSEVLGDVGRDYAERIEAASQRMATLIDDLLHLSQVSRAEMNLERVDLSAEVAAICGELRAGDPGRQVHTAIQEDVLVTADRSLIRIALESLLDNAWKFTGQRADARVEFGTGAAPDGATCCFVRDNGVGFDPAYAGNLFHPFQRLHAAADFPGSGVGLASVRQIIERHGGRAWAEGGVGQGATFYFTLPPADPPQRPAPAAGPRGAGGR